MRSVRWGWIVLAAFVAELVGIVGLMVIRVLHGYGPVDVAAPLSAIGGTAFMLELGAAMALSGWWVAARKARSNRLMHGLLVGVAAVVLYEILTFRQPIPVDLGYILVHVLKVAAGGLGGWFAQWQHARVAIPTAVSSLTK